MVDFLVVGAGLAGIACASDLQANGSSVLLLDKGRGIGGRAATRRFEGTRVDHGAQYFTARTPRLQSIVAEGITGGWLKEWCRGYPTWENGVLTSRPEGHPRYVCPQGMNDLPKHLAASLPTGTGATVTTVRRAGDGFVAEAADGRTFTGQRLLLNLPPVQLLAIAGSLLTEETRESLESVAFAPAWTLIAALDADVPGANWPGMEVKHPVVGWVARDHTRRADPTAAPPVLVAHGTGDWSRAHLEDNPADVETALRNAVTEIVGPLGIREAQVHRWRYAQPTQALSIPFLLTDDGIGACGDWCAPGGRVEGALESGWSLAVALRAG